MLDLQFYEVDAAYIDYLLNVDAKVPHMNHSSTSSHDNALYGIILRVDSHDYFAPISSFSTPQRTNILIRNAKGRVLSSIRLSFMIPILPGIAALKNIGSEESKSYQYLLYNELRFCNRNADYIRKRARIIYDTVTVKKDAYMRKNCCDFKALEAACAEYVKGLQEQNGGQQPFYKALDADDRLHEMFDPNSDFTIFVKRTGLHPQSRKAWDAYERWKIDLMLDRLEEERKAETIAAQIAAAKAEGMAEGIAKSKAEGRAKVYMNIAMALLNQKSKNVSPVMLDEEMLALGIPGEIIEVARKQYEESKK